MCAVDKSERNHPVGIDPQRGVAQYNQPFIEGANMHHADGSDGTAGDISEAGEGGGGGNNAGQAYGASGGEGGGQGEAADAGGGAQHGAGAGGNEGSAIRKASGVNFTLNNSGSVVGNTNQTGVS